MAHLAVFVLYLLWFSIVFAVVVLWFVALSDIKDHARKGSFSTAQLAAMAVAVSFVAAGAIVSADAVVRDAWTEAAPTASSNAPPNALPERDERPSYTFTYAFGLESAHFPKTCTAQNADRPPCSP